MDQRLQHTKLETEQPTVRSYETEHHKRIVSDQIYGIIINNLLHKPCKDGENDSVDPPADEFNSPTKKQPQPVSIKIDLSKFADMSAYETVENTVGDSQHRPSTCKRNSKLYFDKIIERSLKRNSKLKKKKPLFEPAEELKTPARKKAVQKEASEHEDSKIETEEVKKPLEAIYKPNIPKLNFDLQPHLFESL